MLAIGELDDALPFLQRVATNHCLNLLRARRKETLDADAAPERTTAPAALDDQQLCRQALLRADALTGQIVCAVLVEGEERNALADQLRISRKTVARKLERFLASTRDWLKEGLR